MKPGTDKAKEELYQGLHALEESLFPKTCRVCGAEFHTLDEFVQKTLQITDTSGLTFFETPSVKLYLGLFRNCVCGSTLLVPCSDRRGSSPEAVRRRAVFGQTLELLVKQGWERESARRELLKFMQGKKSRVVEPAGAPKKPKTK